MRTRLFLLAGIVISAVIMGMMALVIVPAFRSAPPQALSPTTGVSALTSTSPSATRLAGGRNPGRETPTVTPSDSPGTRITPHASSPTPTPQPTPPSSGGSGPGACNGLCPNPWGYTFIPGSLIYTPPGSFCRFFPCIASFWEPDDPGDGYVVECGDGLYSQSGGEAGACSGHLGEAATLYAPVPVPTPTAIPTPLPTPTPQPGPSPFPTPTP